MESTAQLQNARQHYVPTFHFDRLKSCYCGSKSQFGDCCASFSSKNTSERPRFINVIHNYVPSNECRRFLRFSEKQKREWLTVVDKTAGSSGKHVERRDPSRITQRVHLRKNQTTASEWMKNACINYLEKAGQSVQWFEPPQLLRYGPGGKYDIHSDAEHFCTQSKQFYRFIDRDFSMLIYLNDNYEGGGLYFPGLDYLFQPQAGDLVIFPSNHIFTHQSLPVTKGTKHALVTWGAVTGSARVSRPQSIIPVRKTASRI